MSEKKDQATAAKRLERAVKAPTTDFLAWQQRAIRMFLLTLDDERKEIFFEA